MAELNRVAWLTCPACKGGCIALFTSVVRCAECMGTGYQLSAKRLDIDLDLSEMAVRTRKCLYRQQISTLRQLLCLVFNKTPAELSADDLVVSDIERTLLENHLPSGYWRAVR